MENTSVHKNAKIGKDVVIGPFSYIEEHVEIGDGSWIGPNVTIFDYVKIGKNCRIFPGAVIGAIPQDLKFAGETTYVEIGDNTTIRECATINRGTKAKGTTRIGSNCLIMSYVHIAHDCNIGNNCIMTSYVGVAGETDVEEWAIVGGGSLAHQFSRIGAHAMIGGGCTVTKDVPPYVLAARSPLSYEGINVVGLKRRGFTNEVIEEIRDIYRVIFESNYNISEAIELVTKEFPQSDHRDRIIKFISDSRRGVIRLNKSVE